MIVVEGTRNLVSPGIQLQSRCLCIWHCALGTCYWYDLLFTQFATFTFSGKFDPYEHLSVNEVKEGVVAGLRPSIPENVVPMLQAIMKSCWLEDPRTRPSFIDVLQLLDIAEKVAVSIVSTCLGALIVGARKIVRHKTPLLFSSVSYPSEEVLRRDLQL